MNKSDNSLHEMTEYTCGYPYYGFSINVVD